MSTSVSDTYTVELSSANGPIPAGRGGMLDNLPGGAVTTMIMVGGEDGTDGDYNDAVLLLTSYAPASGAATRASAPRGAAAMGASSA